jgi:hypothetical protein
LKSIENQLKSTENQLKSIESNLKSIDINWSNFMQYLVAKIITLNWSLKLFGGVPTLTRIQQ